ncbi:PTS glucose/sucrose transporter subunit IIB, partial [Streptomyces goshikiensis]
MSPDTHRATAAAILPLVGGPDNITSVAHCMTRLRIGLRDRALVQDESLKALPAVLGVVDDDTYQIVLGPGAVARVTPEFEALVQEGRAGEPRAAEPPRPVTAAGLADRGAALREARKARNATPLKLFLRRGAYNIVPPIPPRLRGARL